MNLSRPCEAVKKILMDLAELVVHERNSSSMLGLSVVLVDL